MTKLLPICLALSLIGIFTLLLLSNIKPKTISLDEINNKLLGKQIKINAKITKIRSYEQSNFQIISVKDSTGEIDIILNKILNLKNNQSINVIGKITEYNKTLQITANKIIDVS